MPASHYYVIYRVQSTDRALHTLARTLLQLCSAVLNNLCIWCLEEQTDFLEEPYNSVNQGTSVQHHAAHHTLL
jgi:hypothetical protein